MDRVARSQYYQQILRGLTPLQRHQQLVSQALQQLPPGSQQGVLGTGLHATETDYDALRKYHRFLRGPEDDAQEEGGGNSWGARLARRYYSRLFKEYAIADLSRYRESKIGLRWRTQAEVVAGKGQFTCGAKGCDSGAQLCAYEVNFAYSEAGQHKQALVKLCLCEDCACRLNYQRGKGRQYRKLGGSTAFDQQQQQEQEEQQERRQERELQERHMQRRRRDTSSSSSSGRNGEDVRQRRLQQQQQQDSRRQHWDSPGRGSHGRAAADAADDEPREHRQRERSVERRVQQRGSDSSLSRAAAEGEAAVRRDCRGSGRGLGLDCREERPRGADSRGAEGAPGGRVKGEATAAAEPGAAVDPSPRGAGAGRVQQDRWQMDGDEDGGEVAAEARAAEGASDGAGGGGDGVGVSDRWELHDDGDLNDADIERWLDSLFTAVQAGPP